METKTFRSEMHSLTVEPGEAAGGAGRAVSGLPWEEKLACSSVGWRTLSEGLGVGVGTTPALSLPGRFNSCKNGLKYLEKKIILGVSVVVV